MHYLFMILLLLVCRPIIADELVTVKDGRLGVAYHFAIAPQQSPRELAKRWGPIIQYISEHSGVSLRFQTATSLTAYQHDMKAGLYDISFINAYYYVAYSKDARYQVFAQEKDAKFVGVMVVRKDSPYQKLEDLQGQPLAFPSPTAVTSMLACTQLKENNIKFTPNYVISMDSVYRSVAKGLFSAGQGEMRTFGSMVPEVRDQLRILWSSEPMPPFTFSVHPRVPKENVQKIQKVMVEMENTEEGRELLKGINMKGIAIAHDSEYEPVRKRKLLTLDVPLKP